MENIDFEKKIEENTEFLYDHFYKEKMRFSHGFCFDCPDEVEALKLSIEILKSGQYSKPQFKNRVLNTLAIPFLNDFYLLEYYRKGKESIIHSIEKEQTKYDNDPDKDDFLMKQNFCYYIEKLQNRLKEIDNIIKLTNEFRTLINEAFPNIEDDFKLKLQKFNDFQESEAEKTAKDKEERRLKREEKQKQIEEQNFSNKSKNKQTFTDYLTGCKNKQDVISFINNQLNLSNKKNVTIALLTLALIQKGYIQRSSIENSKTDFHKALMAQFGKIGFLNRFGDVFNRVGTKDEAKKDRQTIDDYVNTLP
jgi:hypothetical protein